MNLPRIVFQRFIKFARQAAIQPVHSHFLLESERCALHTHIPKLFAAAKFLSEILYAGKHWHDNRICTQACVLLPPPANKYADVSATTSYYDHKNDKEGYRLSNHLEILEYIWKRTITDVTRLSLKSMHPQHLFLAIIAIAFEDLAVFSTANSLPLRFKRG